MPKNKKQTNKPFIRCAGCINPATNKCTKCDKDICANHTFYDMHHTILCFSCLFFPKKEQNG